jgi:hypothetical protein
MTCLPKVRKSGRIGRRGENERHSSSGHHIQSILSCPWPSHHTEYVRTCIHTPSRDASFIGQGELGEDECVLCDQRTFLTRFYSPVSSGDLTVSVGSPPFSTHIISSVHGRAHVVTFRFLHLSFACPDPFRDNLLFFLRVKNTVLQASRAGMMLTNLQLEQWQGETASATRLA